MSGSNDIRTDAQGGQNDAAAAGKQLQDPETMSENQQPQTDAQTRNDGHTKVAQAINGFAEMTMERTGGCNYSVYSWRNGSNTVHRVSTSHLTCTCGDMQWNRDGQHDVCDHVAYAVFHAPKDRDIGEEAFGNIVGVLSEMNDYKNALEQRGQETDGQPSDSASDQPQSGADATADETPAVNPQDAADTLQAAYDDVVNDMQVKATASFVWIQTGMDTPDSLPGPGNVDPFDAFLKNPDQMVFVPPDADSSKLPSGYRNAASQKPGEWWKNVLLPEDVDEYISEVLE